ncbi:MAG: DUF3426 domain-containing protein [Gammaproteobacteria bacterium]|nr:DUF3426 domain-containing protein [Gammaproteobacteria bacterium]
MFTNCPACSRQFRVRASQLASAEGLVQCGFCGRQFNALERLYDKPIHLEQKPVPVVDQDTAIESEFFIPEQEENSDGENDTEPGKKIDPDDFQIELPDSLSEHEKDTEPEVSATEDSTFTFELANEPVIASSKESPITAKQPVPDSQDEVVEYPFPEELVNEEAIKPGRLSRAFWSMGVLVLLTGGITQAVWFQRDMLLSQYPELLPYARELCDQLDCVLIRNRNVSAIKLLNRDVRIHPRYEDALLVNATITNLSRYTQRFPDVLLSLLDSNGEVIGYRQIPAKEYLDTSIDIESGMPPDKPIHFVFEVANASTEAVSFEFDFL